MKICVVFHRLGPYHFARLKTASTMISLVAVETSGRDETYAWDCVAGTDGFERLILFKNQDAHKLSVSLVRRQLMLALERIQPAAVVIPGWQDPAAHGAMQYCIQNAKPIIIMSESTSSDVSRWAWREAIKSQIVRLGNAALVGGAPHKNYIVKLGIPARNVFLGYDAIDNSYFSDSVLEAIGHKSEVRMRYRLPELYFLASSRFVEKKNLFRLIEAYARYREMAENLNRGERTSKTYNLVLLGDGALKSNLQSEIEKLNLFNNVFMPGFIQYPDLPAYYACAQVFVHASTTEQWGLVVNEAMASGLPVLVSNRCGCAQDLVREGVNGFTFDPYDVDQMARLMLKMSSSDFPLAAFGSASREIVSHWGPERFAEGLSQAVKVALSTPIPKATWVNKLLLWALLHR